MKRIFFLFFTSFIFQTSFGQAICDPGDLELLEKRMMSLEKMKEDSTHSWMTQIGQTFIDTPYEAATLEVGDDHQLVVRLLGLDCTTFVESVLALSQAKAQNNLNKDSYFQQLEKIRYRKGLMNGYASRLHYFTEWIRDNESMGMMTDLTPQLGEEIKHKEINFMGTHRSSYPALASNDSLFQLILNTESEINQHTLHQIPIQKIASVEAHIQDGDIIALVTNIKGLDVAHTGIAIEVNGRIHLLHASLTHKKVVITQKPLHEWLQGSKRNTGILVARPIF